MSTKSGWFEVDRAGLAKVAGRRNKLFILRELVQNSWDEASTQIAVEVHGPVNGSALSTIIVTDDSPEGFADLSHAYTLFAPSRKVTNAEKRGRFNFGEKLVLALCSEARVETTKGTILFDKGEQRRRSPKKREAGSSFVGKIRLNAEEREALVASARAMLVPAGKRTLVNGLEIFPRKPVAEVAHVLTTEVATDTGALKSEYRGTTLRVYDVLPGEKAHLYEMGIPVVETGDRWHVDVGQKVPLNMERDNVSPSYLRDVRVAVANGTAHLLTVADANAPWARDALADYQCQPETTKTLVRLRFGDNVVVQDPNDPEANAKAAASGYTVVNGSQLSSDEWARVRDAKAMLPAGQVFPTPRPFEEGGRQLVMIERDLWTPAMARFEMLAKDIAAHLLGHGVEVAIACDPGWPPEGCYSRSSKRVIVNAARHPDGWFDDLASESMLEFLIHELAHAVESNHLSERYYDALTRFGAKTARLALDLPAVFQ